MAPPDDRGVSEVVGAVVLFGFLVIAFAIYQGVVIPQQNKAIEFDHNGAAQDAIQDLRNAIRQTATTGTEEAVSIKLGATYPPRVLGINPGGSAGTVTTEASGSIVIRNISGTEAEVTDYFGDTTTTLGPFESKVIVYRPIYFQYREAPSSSYENSVAFNHFPNGANLSMTDQALIKDRRITLIALNGSISEARSDTVSIDTEALSTATNTVSVTDQNGPINITIPTRLTADEWEDLLEGEMTSAGGHVENVTQTSPNQVSIILEEGPEYELRLAKVGVGTDTQAESPKYIVDIEGDDTSIPEGGTQKLVAEVRDRYNNPVSNVSVSATITQEANASDSSESVDPSNAKTNANGRITFTYTAPEDVDSTNTTKINATFDGDGSETQNVTFDVRVLDADGSGGSDSSGGSSDEINPSSDSDALIWVNATEQGSNDVAVFFENTDSSNSATVTDARYQFYSIDSQGGGDKPDPPESLTFDDPSNVVNLSDPFVELDPAPTFGPGEAKTVTLSFYENPGADTAFSVDSADFFIISIRYTVDGTERRATYFIGITDP